MLRNLFLSMMLAAGAMIVAAPAFAGDKAEAAKCDKDGKPCKDGAECKAENCKKK